MKVTNRLFRAFADETRLRILNILTIGEFCVCEIKDILGLSQSKVSRHLTYLKNSGLVSDRREGLWSYYKLTEPNNKIHRNILNCILPCLQKIDFLNTDLKNAKKQCGKKNICN